MSRRVNVLDLFSDALHYGLAVIDGLDDTELEALEREDEDHG